MINKIKHYLFLRKLRKEKTQLLWIAQNDILFFNNYKADLCNVDAEDKLRAELGKESEKDAPNPVLLARLTEKINEAKSIRAAYQKTIKLTEELPDYIEILNDRLRNHIMLEGAGTKGNQGPQD